MARSELPRVVSRHGTSPLRSTLLVSCVASLALLASCATKPLVSHTLANQAPRCAFRDYTLTAGRPSSSDCYPELVRVRRGGQALLRLQQERAIYVRAIPGYMIPEGDSDFCGVLLSADFRRQIAVVRQYDLGKPL